MKKLFSLIVSLLFISTGIFAQAPYQVVNINGQEWMQTNLDVTTYRNGDPIPQAADGPTWAGTTEGAWCYYNNDPANGDRYGKLYNWYAVNDPRGLAPEGWHVASNTEWTALSDFLGGASNAGGALKETGTAYWSSPNSGATNSSGFSGRPGGLRIGNSSFSSINTAGSWHTSSIQFEPYAVFKNLLVNTNSMYNFFDYKSYGRSVRCIADPCTTPTVSCTGNQAANTASNSCNAVVTYTSTSTGTPAPDITYSFAGATLGSGSGDGSGSTFSKGTTIVTITATNSCGTETCSFDVVVTDITPPTINCTGPVTVNNDPGNCTATLADYTSQVFYSDNCPFSTGFAKVSAGHAHTLALGPDGSLWAWGWNVYGEFGNGTTSPYTSNGGSNIPIKIGTDTDWVSIEAGSSSSFAIKSDGTLWAWGLNSTGQLGDGSIIDKLTPVQIGTATNWASIASSYRSTSDVHTMGLQSNGTLWAWGANNRGQLGTGNYTYVSIPTQVGTSSDWASIDLGQFFSLAIKTNGTMWSWGQNFSFELGTGIQFQNELSPVQIGTDNTWTNVKAGRSHGLAMKSDGTLWTWGSNQNGQLAGVMGHYIGAALRDPLQIGTATDWTSISAGWYFSLALKSNGELWSSGSSPYGQRGPGATVANALEQVGTATDWGTIETGNDHSTVFKTDGTLWAWGWNVKGQLGTGAPTSNTGYINPALVVAPVFSAITQSPAPGTLLPIGDNTITFSVTDASGNSNSCTQVVTVTDISPPSITCAGPVTINTSSGLCTGTTTLTPPTVSDNCTGAGNALDFDGVNDYVSIPHSPSLAIGTSPVSIECWFTAPNVNQTGMIVAKAQIGSPFTQISIYANSAALINPSPGKKLSFLLYTGGVYRSITTVNDVIDGGTHHLAAVADPVTQTLNLYIDGVLQPVNALSAGSFPSIVNNVPYTVGSRDGTNLFSKVKVDELRIWNTVRTQAEIQTNMNTELNVQSGLVASFHFNEGVAGGNNAGIITAADASGNNNNGTLNNFALTGSTSNWVAGNVASGPTVTNDAPATYPIGETTVTWTATDASNNSETCTQVVTVVAPEINVSGNAVTIVDGDATPDAADGTDFGQPLPSVPVLHTFTIENNGTAPLEISSLSMSGTDPASFTIAGITTPLTLAVAGSASFTVSFAAAPVGNYNAILNINNDDCDEALYDFALHGEVSCQPAAFSVCPANFSVNNTAGQCNALVTYTATVTGDPAPVVSYTLTGATTGSGSGTGSGSTFNKGVTTVSINATNACGNVNCSFTVTVVDNEAPVPDVTNLPNVTGECSATASAPTATDNCAGTITGTTTDPVSYSAQGTYTITWTYDDGNGNPTTQTQTVIVADMTAPVPDVANLPNVTGECSATATAPTATDNCAGALTGTTTDPVSYTAQGTYTITWTFDDGNGNPTTQTQTVIVADVTAPVPDVTNLPNVTGECSASASAPTATDNCAGAMTGTTTDPVSYSAQGTYTITWTYDDGNGNPTTQTQTVIVADVTAPVPDVTNLPNVTGECSATASAPSATDNCVGTINGTTTDPVSYTAQGTYTITWTFDDGNGNPTTQTQTVIVADVTDPVITCPANTIISYGSNETPAANGTATATDNCTGVSVGTPTDATVNGPGNNKTITRTWTATDGASNTDACDQTITVCDMSVSLGNNRFVFFGIPGQPGATAEITATISGGLTGVTYLWSSANASVNGLTTQTVTPTGYADGTAVTYMVTATAPNGCTATASVTISYFNINCSNNGNNVKVRVCHIPQGNPNNCKSICVSINAYQTLLNNGSYLGYCLPNCALPPIGFGGVDIDDHIVKPDVKAVDIIKDGLFNVKVINNPTSSIFVLKVSGTVKDKVSIRIVNSNGVLVEQRANLNAGQEIRIGANYISGTYFAEITQGVNRKVVKLVKLN